MGFDFDTAIFDGGTLLGADAARLDRIDNGSVGGICDSNTVLEEIRRANAFLGQVDDVVGFDKFRILERRLDVKLSVLNEDILIGDGGLFKLPIAVYGSALIRGYPEP